MIIKGRLSHDKVEKWLEEQGMKIPKYLTELSHLIVEKKGQTVLLDIKKQVLKQDEDDRVLKERENIVSIDRAVKKCQIARQDGFNFIVKEVDLIHESFDIDFSLFSMRIISLKDVEKCWKQNGCLNVFNITRLLNCTIYQYPDMNTIEKWKTEKKISQELYNQFHAKAIKDSK